MELFRNAARGAWPDLGCNNIKPNLSSSTSSISIGWNKGGRRGVKNSIFSIKLGRIMFSSKMLVIIHLTCSWAPRKKYILDSEKNTFKNGTNKRISLCQKNFLGEKNSTFEEFLRICSTGMASSLRRVISRLREFLVLRILFYFYNF